ncbi:acyltransferase family protein, partial [Paenibacillus sp. NPDC056722]|uniref:acyltransferase family protein n=1 Tax=Paenibacillus sp. NPDC056722 TaxID=3345924 RepID=UPI00369ABD88
MEKKIERNTSIDIMRSICTLLIMLAHVELPNLLFNLRTFDVTVLIFLSGISMSYESQIRTVSFGRYLWKRVKKLLIPTYIVLSLIFFGVYVLCFLLNRNYLWSLNQVLLSYALTTSGSAIGYGWIVRIFLMIALLQPFLKFINKKIKNN